MWCFPSARRMYEIGAGPRGNPSSQTRACGDSAKLSQPVRAGKEVAQSGRKTTTGRLGRRSLTRLPGKCLTSLLIGRCVGLLAGRLAGLLVGLLAGCLLFCCVGAVLGWLVGWADAGLQERAARRKEARKSIGFVMSLSFGVSGFRFGLGPVLYRYCVEEVWASWNDGFRIGTDGARWLCWWVCCGLYGCVASAGMCVRTRVLHRW